jgi:hypothetical protein
MDAGELLPGLLAPLRAPLVWIRWGMPNRAVSRFRFLNRGWRARSANLPGI